MLNGLVLVETESLTKEKKIKSISTILDFEILGWLNEGVGRIISLFRLTFGFVFRKKLGLKKKKVSVAIYM